MKRRSRRQILASWTDEDLELLAGELRHSGYLATQLTAQARYSWLATVLSVQAMRTAVATNEGLPFDAA